MLKRHVACMHKPINDGIEPVIGRRFHEDFRQGNTAIFFQRSQRYR
jgi:hypothetical protein